jgi:hypothetical protein
MKGKSIMHDLAHSGQLPLFNLPSTPLARPADPSTSHEAADHIDATGVRSRMMRLALDLITANPGRAAAELEEMSGFHDGAVRKRLNDLRHAGRAKVGEPRTCAVTGRRAKTWFAQEAAQ